MKAEIAAENPRMGKIGRAPAAPWVGFFFLFIPVFLELVFQKSPQEELSKAKVIFPAWIWEQQKSWQRVWCQRQVQDLTHSEIRGHTGELCGHDLIFKKANKTLFLNPNPKKNIFLWLIPRLCPARPWIMDNDNVQVVLCSPRNA